ncbi:hypothetical protein [Pontibacter chitinilyticus]|uniref:hypothetical protein n=1 Tax=Pontibacter chitinilyticus TaxID=2674989 RepID=UPI00321933B3
MPSALPSPTFFKHRRSFAELKQELLGSYFDTWCGLYMAAGKAATCEALLYVDLHAAAGEGLEAPATSLPGLLERLCRSTGKQQDLNAVVRTFYSESDKAAFEQLHQNLQQLPCLPAHAPVSLQDPANQLLLAELLETDCPSLLFLDPFSYPYAQEMVQRCAGLQQSDLFMVLQPDTLRKALTGKKVSPPLEALFGSRLALIQSFCRKEKNSARRDAFILDLFVALWKEKGYYTCCFKVNDPEKELALQFVLFCSRNSSAYQRFKDMLLPYSDVQADGVPLFETNQYQRHQLNLFPQQLPYAVTKLAEELAALSAKYKYKTIAKIGEDHSLGTNYIPANYLAAFELLQAQGKIELMNAKTLQTIRAATPASVVKYKVPS